MSQISTKDDQTLRNSLKKFLILESAAGPDTKYCTGCGATCMHFPAHFQVDGDEDIFTLWLPFCACCNPELLTRMPAVASLPN